MKYKCIGCGSEWGEETKGEEGWFSHGSCAECLRKQLSPIYRKRQSLQGFHDCFARNVEKCSRLVCDYWKVCNSIFVKEIQT